jgi:hypothetical protein
VARFLFFHFDSISGGRSARSFSSSHSVERQGFCVSRSDFHRSTFPAHLLAHAMSLVRVTRWSCSLPVPVHDFFGRSQARSAPQDSCTRS